MRYDYNVSLHRRNRFKHRIFLLTIFIIFLAAVAFAVIRIDAYLEKERNPASSTTSERTTGYFAPTTQIFRSPYFQFQTNKTWAEVPSETTKSKFVYRSLRNNLVEHDLTVYISPIPADVATTYVLPVTLKNNNTELVPQTVSSHCKGEEATTAQDSMKVVAKVNMLCDGDNTQYSVAVGKPGASTTLNMRRPDGAQVDYLIVYRNVTARQEPSQLYDIIASFQTR